MRVLIATPNFLPVIGGAELAVHRLARALVAQGHRPAVLCPDLGPLPEGISYPVWRYRVPPRGGSLAHRLVLAVRIPIAALLNRADVVHAHYADPAGWAAVASRWIHRRPVFVTSHGADLQRAPEIDYGFRLDRKTDARVRRTMERADGLVAISSDIADEMEAAGAPFHRIARIANGVDVEGVRKLARGARSGGQGPVVLAVGRHHPKKAFDDLIRAFARVAGVHTGARLVIVGEGTSWLRPVARTEGVEEKVELMGRIPAEGEAMDPRDALPPALGRLYGRADIFCSPSKVEAFPLVNVEALAAGLPLLLTDISGNREVVAEGCNGLLVPPADIGALASALDALLSDPERCRRFGENSAERAREYDWDRIATQHVNFYRQISEYGTVRVVPFPENATGFPVETGV